MSFGDVVSTPRNGVSVLLLAGVSLVSLLMARRPVMSWQVALVWQFFL